MKNSFGRIVLGCQRRAARVGIACFAAAAVLAAQAQTPAIVTSHSTYFTGEDIVAAFVNGPGNAKDWVGVYPEGRVPGQGGGSTLWYYVDNTQTGAAGLREGSVTFAGGLSFAGNWFAYLLLNDGYTILATTAFTVVDRGTTLIRTDKRTYAPGETIAVAFFYGPAYPKDWIGLYREGQQPGGVDSIRWAYADGAGGTVGLTDGNVQFANGLNAPGNYVAFFLLDDSYVVLCSEPFSVREPSAGKPRLLSQRPANNASNLPPVVEFTLAITNGLSKVVANTVELKVDGAKVNHSLVQQAELVTVTYTNDALFAAGSAHEFALTFADNATPPNNFTIQGAFTVGVYRNLALPAPLYFENFDTTPEGELPAGWTEQNFTQITNWEFDLGNLDSASYATWTAVDADRFKGSFVTYSNPDGPVAWAEDYHRVLSVNPLNVVSGKVYNEPLAKGRFLFGNSGYRNGRSQVMYLFTPDYNLTGKQDVYVSFHSVWEQNQDCMGAVEYSIDQGQTWLPIVYMLQGFADAQGPSDILLDTKGNADALATFNTSYDDVARYTDPNTSEDKGGTYGTFIGAAISQDLAPFISPRVNDDPVESKRIELFRLPAADNQAKVRFRFAHAGTDSWYFGIDDFGLYSISTVEPAEILVEPADVTVTAGETASLSVQAAGTPPLLYEWFHNDQAIPEAAGPSLNFASVKPADAGRYFVRVTNAARSVQSRTATLTVNPRPPAVTGAWDFDQGDLSLTAGVGELAYAGGAATQSLTTFGTTDGTPGAPHINGQPAKFMRVPAFMNAANGYLMTMPTAPNGGGGYVNRYTIVFDLLVPGFLSWAPLFNASPDNGNDADFWVSDTGQVGVGALGYSPADTLAPDTWYRLAFAADLGAGQVAYYVNGSLVHARTGGSLLDGRFSLYSGNDAGPDALFFNEPSGSYTHELLINSLMFTDRRMSAEEIQALGGPSAAGIPADVTPEPLKVAVSLEEATLTLSWSGGKGPYQVQKTPSLVNPSWQNVGAPTTATSLTESVGGSAAFYRVIGQ